MSSKSRKKLVLFDAHAIIHRAYHALPDFSNSKGEPTGALYGLITMLLKITADLVPTYMAAAFDLPGPTHRHEAYAPYKATREKIADELVAQLVRAREVFAAFGIPVYECPGQEADDVLGTIAAAVSKEKDLQTVIASGDMDTLQLVDDSKTIVYTMRKGISDTVLYDEKAVRTRYEFGPEHIADYKALRGDPSDNIKGVRGIGEKTATELIVKFGSIEEIYKILAKSPDKFLKAGIKPRTVELLREGERDAQLSKGLATIRRDAKVSYDLPKEPWHLALHAKNIIALCETLEFRTLRERVAMLAQVGALEEAPPAKLDVPPSEIEETAVALWLLNSDLTTPSLDDILQRGEGNFEKAKRDIFGELGRTGRLQEVFERIEKPLIPVVRAMNECGVYLDVAYFKGLAKEYKKELSVMAGRIYKAAGREFNVSSPKQLAVVLYDELKLSLPRQKRTPGGARTTREDELSKMADQHRIVADILSYRELQKLLSTYVEKMPALAGRDGRLHTEFLQSGTTTGRIASRNPNLQNIPIKTEYGRRVRKGFTGEVGNVLVAIDYSQIELRIAAGLSGDKKLGAIFKEGGDVHTAVASQVFGVSPEKVDYEMRRRAKVINFGILYGMGVNALKANLGADVTRDEAAAFLDAYFKGFTGLALWIENTKLDAARRGFTETLFGRRRYFPGFRSALPNLRAQAERMAINAPIQGTQSDIIKLAMVEADRYIEKNELRSAVRLALQVHDELVYEVDRKKAQEEGKALKRIMESVVPGKLLHDVPIRAEVSIGDNWSEMQRIQE